MIRRIILSIAVVLSFSASTVFARVSGLPDFTGLVEEAVPAVATGSRQTRGGRKILMIRNRCPSSSGAFLARPERPVTRRQGRRTGGVRAPASSLRKMAIS